MIPAFHTALRFFLLGLCCLWAWRGAAQPPAPVYVKIEKAYRYIGNDSFPRYFKKWIYGKDGLLNDQQEFHYNDQPGSRQGTLAMEDYHSYNPETGNYIFKRTQFNRAEPATETFQALYLRFDNDPANRKPIWTKTLDNYREIIKEDTCAYDQLGNALRCDYYNYLGNTSLFTDKYKYDSKNRLKVWKTYYRWTTVTITGKTPVRQALRRRYVYRYNAAGLLLGYKGFYYKNKMREKREYDRQGQILSIENSQKRRSRNSKKKRQETHKAFTLNLERRLQQFKNGRLVSDCSYKNDQEEKAMLWEYQDSLLLRFEQRERGKVFETRDYIYNGQGIPTAKTTERYDSEGKLRYTVRTEFDERGNPVKETQVNGTTIFSILQMEYNEYNQLISNTVYLNGTTKYEKVFVEYTYHEAD